MEALMTPAPVVANQIPARATATVRPVRQPLPANLETERVVLEPEEVKQQPAGWRKLGEEVTEELDWKPAKFIKRSTSGPSMPTPNASSLRRCPPV